MVQALLSWFSGAVVRIRALWRYAQRLKEAIISGLASKKTCVLRFSQVFVVLFRQSAGRQRHLVLLSLWEVSCSPSLIRCDQEDFGKQRVWYVAQAILCIVLSGVTPGS